MQYNEYKLYNHVITLHRTIQHLVSGPPKNKRCDFPRAGADAVTDCVCYLTGAGRCPPCGPSCSWCRWWRRSGRAPHRQSSSAPPAAWRPGWRPRRLWGGDNTNTTATTTFSRAHVVLGTSSLPLARVCLAREFCPPDCFLLFFDFFFAPPTSLRVSAQSGPPVPHHPHLRCISNQPHLVFIGSLGHPPWLSACVLVFWKNCPFLFFFGLVDVSACLAEQRKHSISLNLSLPGGGSLLFHPYLTDT